jgi:hypothetical protein
MRFVKGMCFLKEKYTARVGKFCFRVILIHPLTLGGGLTNIKARKTSPLTTFIGGGVYGYVAPTG